jgi:hypothetical protein
MPVFCAVRSMASPSEWRTAIGRRSWRPIARMRTLRRITSGSSVSKNSDGSFISSSTSALGRFQFSDEKA